MPELHATLREALQVDGAIAVGVVDYLSGATLGVAVNGTSFDPVKAATVSAEILLARWQHMERVGISGLIEDVVATVEARCHLIRPLDAGPGKHMLAYIVMQLPAPDDLEDARGQLRRIERSIER